MTSERWRQIAHLFDTVLECEPPQRAAFLAEQCAGDDAMRREVEFLVLSYEKKKASAEGSAGRVASDGLLQDQISKPTNSYQAYQLSRYYYHNVSFPDLEQSRFWLEESLRFDQDFAPAHIALAEQCVMEAITGLRLPDENFPLARAALRRAFELESDSAELYTVAGFVDLICEWNFAGAERNLGRALELNPYHAFAHKYLGEVLMFQGRADESLSHLREAQRIDPMNLHVGIILTMAYFLARDYQSVITECEKSLAIYPSFVVAAWMRCWALEQTGRAGEALVEYERILREPGGEIAERYIGYAYALVGDRENALKTAAQLDEESRWPYLSPTHQAQIYAALGESEKAFSCLEKGIIERDPWMLWIATDPRFDELRVDSRFDDVIRRVGLRVPAAIYRTARIQAERWLRIDQLFHAALAKEPAERAQYLIECCAGDDSLRLEIESLLSNYAEAQDFIEAPPGDFAAEMFGAQGLRLEAGHRIGNYSIVRRLGSGGMGEVYLADDVRLNRKVALKVLPPYFTGNAARVRRFEQEARAVSALNHPNIVTVYEIGESSSANFMVTEFVDGQTLREMMKERPLTLNETLSVVLQIAAALDAAHGSGIIHRDIKPENVMVRSDGYVKVLDFGLAKLTDLPTSPSESETPTLLQSNPGLVMGTVEYMSPEQARGKKVDRRADIWSLGIVLYELLTGHVPFSGETPSHVMVSLMEDELPPITDRSNVPAELARIVTRALIKKRKERYQTVHDLADDLKNLKQDLQVEARLKGALEAVPLRNEKPKSDEHSVSGALASVTRTVDIGVTHETSSAEYLRSWNPRSGRSWAVVLAVALVFGVTVFTWYWFARRNRTVARRPEAFQNIEFTRLTNTGRVRHAVISPDGRYLAYVAQVGGRESIWLKQVGTSDDAEIVPPAEKEFFGTTFSLDGNHLYYVVRERNNTIGVLHEVSVPSGISSRLVVDVDSPVSLSPDGRQFAFVRGSSGGKRALILANADGSGERTLPPHTGYGACSFEGPAWLPDGKSIACAAGRTDETGFYMSVVAVDVADGSVKPLTSRKWSQIGRMAWLLDGRGLVLAATDYGRKSPAQLWYLSYPNGEARRITRDLQDYEGVSLTSNSTVLVSNQKQTVANIWNAPNDDANRAKQILSNKYDGEVYDYYNRFSFAPNGQIIYTSPAHGTPSIWSASDEGTGNRQLTPESSINHFPAVTSDARYVVFLSDRTGAMNVWRMDLDGRNEMQLTRGKDDSWPWCSPDGQWVVYHSLVPDKRTLHRVSINGGEPEQLTDYSSVCPTISPDGKWISCYYRLEAKAPWKLAIISFDGGLPVRSFDVPENLTFTSLVRWTPDGRALAYITNRDGIANIWIQPIDGGPPKQLTDFKSDEMFWFDWSRDGRQLGVSRGNITSDVVMIKDLLAQASE